MRRQVASLCVLAWAAAAPARAQEQAAPRTSSLSWVRMPGAERCVPSRGLAEAVEARLGRTVFVSAADAELAVEGRVEPEGEGFRATIVLSEAGGEVLGERSIATDDPSCAALAEPLALVVAVMIDPDAALRPESEPSGDELAPENESENEPQEPPRVEERVVVRRERVVVERDAPSWRVELDGTVGAALGRLPGVAPSVAGAVYVEPPHFIGIELGLGLLPYASHDGVTFAMGWGQISVCPFTWRPSDLSVGVCGGVNLGVARFEADAGEPAGEEKLTGEVVLHGRLGWRLFEWLSLLARPAVLVPVRRDVFTYEDGMGAEQTVYDPWPVAVMVDLGVGIHLE